MARLTERTVFGICGNNDRVKNYPLYKVAQDDPLDHGITGQCFEKLAAYEDAEENGYLFILPVKNGDKVYHNWLCGKNGPVVTECIVDQVKLDNFPEIEFSIKNPNIKYATVGCRFLKASDIGKKIFLSYEEAEKALKESKENKKSAKKTAELVAKIREMKTVDEINELYKEMDDLKQSGALKENQIEIINKELSAWLKQKPKKSKKEIPTVGEFWDEIRAAKTMEEAERLADGLDELKQMKKFTKGEASFLSEELDDKMYKLTYPED